MRRTPAPNAADEADASPGLLSRAIPESVALRALSVDVRGPETVRVDEPSRFLVSVRNRLPVPVSLALPTSRVWGWRVDDVPEADDRRYEPPGGTRRVTFGRGERRLFEATWDGRIRRSARDGQRWVPSEGTVTFLGYLAVENWERRGLYETLEVTVVSPV